MSSTFRIAIRSATNILKFGLPEESKRPIVVPVKVEVRFITKAMADTLRVYREAIQTRDILSRKISKLQSMRRELDMSLSEASAVTSTSNILMFHDTCSRCFFHARHVPQREVENRTSAVCPSISTFR